MSIIPIKNPELYRRWLEYFGESTAQTRTQAFFNSQKGLQPSMLARWKEIVK